MNALINSQMAVLREFRDRNYPDAPVRFEQYTRQTKQEDRERIIKDPPHILLTKRREHMAEETLDRLAGQVRENDRLWVCFSVLQAKKPLTETTWRAELAALYPYAAQTPSSEVAETIEVFEARYGRIRSVALGHFRQYREARNTSRAAVQALADEANNTQADWFLRGD